MIKRILCLAAVSAALFGPAARADEAGRYGLQYLARFDRLPVLKGTVCKQVSSYDRSGGNGDAGHFLNGDAGKLPNDTALLADLKGPGCVYRLWSANATGDLRVYIDGETTPRIACPMQDLFLNRYAPFVYPLAAHVSGGWYSYFPIPYEKSIRIEVVHPQTMYYHVQYQELPKGTPVRSFTRELTLDDREALATVLSQWRELGSPPVPPGPEGRRTEGEAELSAAGSVDLLDQRGGGTVRVLKVRVQPANRFTLRNLVLRATWDGAKTPAVEAPVGDFFGSAFGDQRYRSMPLAMRNDGYYCYFPMPFRRSARISVANEGSEPVRVSWEVEVGPAMRDPAGVGYFHAAWRRVTTQAGKHVTLLQTAGRGHFAGVNVNMQGDRGIGYLEGDEKIYVDGETFPSIYGTGSEDYYTGGWYFDEGTFSLPYHGCVVKDDPASRVTAYRYQMPDCVPFRKSIRVDIEHGGVNDYPGADYAYTTYWYQDTPTSDWSGLAPAAQRRPPSIVARGVIEAEGLGIQNGAVVDDERLPLELSRGKAVAGSGAGPLALRFDVTERSYYTVALGALKGPGIGMARVSIDGKPVGTVDLKAGTSLVERTSVGNVGPLEPGPHTLTIETDGAPVTLDYIGFRKQVYPGALEGERMKLLEATPGEPLDPQELTGFGQHWSGDAQIWFRPSRAGTFFTLELPVEAAGKYHLLVYFTKAVDYGQVQVSVDGKNVGPVFDGFNDGVIPSGKVDLGEIELSAGKHALRFTVVGKNPRAIGYMVGVDAVALAAGP